MVKFVNVVKVKKVIGLKLKFKIISSVRSDFLMFEKWFFLY